MSLHHSNMAQRRVFPGLFLLNFWARDSNSRPCNHSDSSITITDDPKIFFHFVFSLSRCCFVTLTKVRNPFWPLRQKCLSAKWLLVGALYYSISWGMKRNMKECLNFWPKNIGLESKQYIWAQCWCKDNDSNNNYWFQQLNSANLLNKKTSPNVASQFYIGTRYGKKDILISMVLIITPSRPQRWRKSQPLTSSSP